MGGQKSHLNHTFTDGQENYHNFIFIIFAYPFGDRKPLKGTLVNSEDPDEMLHNVAFQPGLQCLLRQKGSSEK